jgi:protein phosphatase
MGGHAGGEVASAIAVDAIESFIQHTDGAGPDFSWPLGFDPGLGLAGTRLTTAFRLANRAIAVRMQDDPALTGMATTAVALLVPPADRRAAEPESVTALVAHVGDSRAYLWREGVLEQITHDHSWVEEQVASGALTEDEARRHPWRNLVTRALAGGDDPEIDLAPLALEPGDRVLLCTDGLTSVVRDEAIAAIIGRAPGGRTSAICQDLVDAANAAGGPDNVTVLVVEIGPPAR